MQYRRSRYGCALSACSESPLSITNNKRRSIIEHKNSSSGANGLAKLPKQKTMVLSLQG
jgi:hypothetical protein